MVYYQKVIKTLFVFIKTGLKLNTELEIKMYNVHYTGNGFTLMFH